MDNLYRVEKVAVWGDSVMKGVIYDESRDKYALLPENGVEMASRTLGMQVRNRARMGCTVSKGMDILKKDLTAGIEAVSYTHLDVYKRQRRIPHDTSTVHRPAFRRRRIRYSPGRKEDGSAHRPVLPSRRPGCVPPGPSQSPHSRALSTRAPSRGTRFRRRRAPAPRPAPGLSLIHILNPPDTPCPGPGRVSPTSHFVEQVRAVRSYCRPSRAYTTVRLTGRVPAASRHSEKCSQKRGWLRKRAKPGVPRQMLSANA